LSPDLRWHRDTRRDRDILHRPLRPRHRFGHKPDQRHDGGERDEIHHIGKLQRPCSVLGKQARKQRADAKAGEIGRCCDHRRAGTALLSDQLCKPGSSGSGTDADREPAQDPSAIERGNAAREQEHQRAEQRQRHARERHRPPADLVGEAAEHQKRAEISDDIGRIDQRQRDLREAERLLVHDVERRHDRAAGEQHADHGGDRADTGRALQLESRMGLAGTRQIA
jgi:hypothetical protein